MDKSVTLIARILLAHIFVLAGINKITGYTGTQAYMEAFGLPGALLPLVIALELGGGLALALGWFSRGAAWALAAFTIVAGVVFHTNFADQVQMIMFMKNLAIVGGLLMVAIYGAGALSLDHALRKKA